MKHAAASIDVTAIGLVSSVGHDALTACAAIRAGISRPAEIDGTKALDLGSAKSVPMTGHPIAPFTNGFSGTARWLQIAPRAFDDLVKGGRLPPPEDAGFWASTAVMLLVADLGERRFAHDPRSDAGAITTTFVAPLRKRLPAALPARNVLIQPVDRIGLALVVEGFRKLTEDMKVERVIVLAVDSYLCPFALDWLGEAGRLKSDLNPVGLVPGEAAAALLLERSLRGAHPDRPALARIIAVATAQDAHLEGEDARPRGRALADVLRPLLTDETGDLYLDLNGEEWRAREYGHALVELAPRALGPARLHHPAAEIGDTGSAAFVVSTILAARSLQRGYAGGPQVAVATSVETGEIGGLLLRRVEGG